MKSLIRSPRRLTLAAVMGLVVASALAAPAADAVDGEIRKVDKENGKLTIKHAEIKSLDMPAMTMVFQVKDRAMLDKLQPGAKVKFKAVQQAGQIVIVDIQTTP